MSFTYSILVYYVIPIIELISLKREINQRLLFASCTLIFINTWILSLCQVFTLKNILRNNHFSIPLAIIIVLFPVIMNKFQIYSSNTINQRVKKRIIIFNNGKSILLVLLSTVGISACKGISEVSGPLYYDQWVELIQSALVYKGNSKVVIPFVTKYFLENLILVVIMLICFHFWIHLKFTIYKFSYMPTYRLLSIIYLTSFIYHLIPLCNISIITGEQFLKRYSVLPNSKLIDFPKKKKNLIFISLEAYEAMYFSKEHGGIYEKSKSPNLERIALSDNAIFFSHLDGDKFGGANVIPRTKFSIAAQFAMSCGYAFLSEPPRGGLRDSDQYYPKFQCIWDILREMGYNTTVTYGSTLNDWGTGELYNSHQVHKVFSRDDIIPNAKEMYALDRDIVPFFKKVLTEMGQSKDPFFATILTLDTHEPGFLCPDCITDDNKMLTTVKCSDKRISELLQWMENQSWYNDTVIALFGDHIVRGNGYPELAEKHNFSRRPFNMIINSGLKSDFNRKREFTSMDIYPTLLASIGAKIKTTQLGMGVNLFSGEPTLVEKFGLKKIINECEGTRIFYDKVILGKDSSGVRIKGSLKGSHEYKNNESE